jgi:hypothetical protein
MASDFLQRKMAEYEALRAEIVALRAEMAVQRRPATKNSRTQGRP